MAPFYPWLSLPLKRGYLHFSIAGPAADFQEALPWASVSSRREAHTSTI